ncbi:MAG TPA: helix-turn-helix domain-containing protein [Dehalococcoidia bacterium]|nr:helix-turn-helix domain-containing protein [Dehalococcoidia bacterium]
MTSLGDAGRLLTIEEAAKRFRVSVSTMYRWCRTGRLPAFKIGRGWLIPLGSVPDRPTERFALIRDYLRRTVHAGAARGGQLWLVLSQADRDHQHLREAVERFVLSRRRTRLGRLWWTDGPEFSSTVTDHSGGFEARLLLPADIAPDELERRLLEDLRPQARRASFTYLLSESELSGGHADCERVAMVDGALGAVARSLGMTVLAHRLLGQEHPASDVVRAAIAYDGIIGAYNGKLFALRGHEILPG